MMNETVLSLFILGERQAVSRDYPRIYISFITRQVGREPAVNIGGC